MTDVTRRLIELALAEDLGDAGDVTGTATVPTEAHAGAWVVARQAGVVAGLGVIAMVCEAVAPDIEIRLLAADGDAVTPGQRLAELRGPARGMLAAERTVLNLVTHLSGVATATAQWVAALHGTGCQVRDTRKTMPGMRALEKAAVAAGGGTNHRLGLYDSLLVKDNHVAAAGGVAAATKLALANARGLPVQVEVDSLVDLDEALGAGARSVLLDNFDVDTTHEAVRRCREKPEYVFIEASGGLTLQRARAVAATGVDAIAVGAITHSAPALDLGLDWD